MYVFVYYCFIENFVRKQKRFYFFHISILSYFSPIHTPGGISASALNLTSLSIPPPRRRTVSIDSDADQTNSSFSSLHIGINTRDCLDRCALEFWITFMRLLIGVAFVPLFHLISKLFHTVQVVHSADSALTDALSCLLSGTMHRVLPSNQTSIHHVNETTIIPNAPLNILDENDIDTCMFYMNF